MRRPMIMTALCAVALMVGCAADADRTSDTLVEVDVEGVTGEVLYFAPDVSAIPFTEAELAEWSLTTADAIPIRIEILDTTAVAWYAPEGEAIIGRDTIIALWGVTHVTPIDGEVAPGDDTTQTPGAIDVVVTGAADRGLDREITVLSGNDVAKAILDFADRLGSPNEIMAIEELQGYHPGC